MRALLPCQLLCQLVCAYFLFLLFNEIPDFEGPRGLERVLHTHTHTNTHTHTHTDLRQCYAYMPVLISTRSYMLLKIDSGWGRGMWLVIVAMLVLGVVVRRRHYGCSCAYGLWHRHGSVRYGPARSGPVWLSSV